jgi:hypothetical protein
LFNPQPRGLTIPIPVITIRVFSILGDAKLLSEIDATSS